MIRQKAQNIRYFFYSRHVSDALLITAGILIPSVLLARYNLFETGTMVSLGAMCVGVTDLPGTVKEKSIGMLICNGLMFVVALITGYAGVSPWLEGMEIIVLCFLFSMFTLYGSRAAGIGTTSLMVMIVMMYKHPVFSLIPFNALLLLTGGLWYMLLSFLFYRFLPFRQVQQVLGECILETTKALRLKAQLYDLHTEQTEGLNRLFLQQVRTSEKQDDVRRLLFSNEWIKNESSHKGKLLMKAFFDLMDVYEQVIYTSYYENIRVRFGATGVLPVIESLLMKMADNLTNAGHAIQSNSNARPWIDTSSDFLLLKKKTDEIALTLPESPFILKKAIITFRTMDQRIKGMIDYINSPSTIVPDPGDTFQYSMFLTPRNFSIDLLLGNLSFRSSTFRYALRVALVAFVGFGIANVVAGQGHSYWILFTIVFIMKPAFSLSKQRNYQRIGGTLGGGLISFPILLFVHDKTFLFIILMAFMIVAYSFMRINYLVFVVFMTSYVLLMFKLLGTSGLDIVEERIVDTLIGATVTFLAIYFVFPNWEYRQIRTYITDMVTVNRDYLKILFNYFSGKDISVNEYKLARKEAYVGFANLAASFQRMTSEPKSKQRNVLEIQRFLIANHELSSLISSNSAALFTGKLAAFRNTSGNLRDIGQSIALMDETLELVNPSAKASRIKTESEPVARDSQPVKSQMRLIRERAGEIRKTAQQILNPTSL